MGFFWVFRVYKQSLLRAAMVPGAGGPLCDMVLRSYAPPKKISRQQRRQEKRRAAKNTTEPVDPGVAAHLADGAAASDNATVVDEPMPSVSPASSSPPPCFLLTVPSVYLPF